MNVLTDDPRHIIRKVYMMNDANAKALIHIAMGKDRQQDYDNATEFRAMANGIYYANITLQVELEKAGLVDILKGV